MSRPRSVSFDKFRRSQLASSADGVDFSPPSVSSNDNLQLVRSSWDRLAHKSHEVARVFYGVLQSESEEMMAIFGHVDMPKQEVKLAHMLGMVVGYLEAGAIDSLRTQLRALAARHETYGAELRHYPLVGEALLTALERCDPEWTETTKAAWASAYERIAGTMLNAHAERLEISENDHHALLDRTESLGNMLAVDDSFSRSLRDVEWDGPRLRQTLDSLRRRFLSGHREEAISQLVSDLVATSERESWERAARLMRRQPTSASVSGFRLVRRWAARSALRVRAFSTGLTLMEDAHIQVSLGGRTRTSKWVRGTARALTLDVERGRPVSLTFRVISGKPRRLVSSGEPLATFHLDLTWPQLNRAPDDGLTEMLSDVKDEKLTLFVHLTLEFRAHERDSYLDALHTFVMHSRNPRKPSLKLKRTSAPEARDLAPPPPSDGSVLEEPLPMLLEEDVEDESTYVEEPFDALADCDAFDGAPAALSQSGYPGLGAYEMGLAGDTPVAGQSDPQASLLDKRFQASMDHVRLEPDNIEAWLGLHRVVLDFERVATSTAHLLVQEYWLPPEERTIAPVAVGGVLGGRKYIHQGIFYKLALPDGKVISDAHTAAKVAGNELKGAKSYLGAAVPGLTVALMCVVDYFGFRVLCQGRIPISDKTLVYGSSNAGLLMRDSSGEARRLMAEAAWALNLKPHYVGDRLMWMAGDLEVHYVPAYDKHYVVDLSRAMPPEGKSKIFTNFLRPELVARAEFSLSPDAFSGFKGKEFAQDCAEVNSITIRLLSVVVPETATRLDAYFCEKWHEGVSGEDRLRDIDGISNHLHASGINMRHIGAIESNSRSQEFRFAARVEVFARLLKHQIRHAWRSADPERMRTGFFSGMHRIAAELFRLVQQEKYWSDVLIPKAREFFSLELPAHLFVYAGLNSSSPVAPSPTTRRKLLDRYRAKLVQPVPLVQQSWQELLLGNPVFIATLWLRVAKMLGITWNQCYHSLLYETLNGRSKLTESEFLRHLSTVDELSFSVNCTIKSLHLCERAQGMVALLRAKQRQNSNLRTAFLGKAIAQFQVCLQDGTVASVPLLLASAEALELQAAEENRQEIALLYDRALEIEPDNIEVMKRRAIFEERIGDVFNAQYFYLKTLYAADSRTFSSLGFEYEHFLRRQGKHKQRQDLIDTLKAFHTAAQKAQWMTSPR